MINLDTLDRLAAFVKSEDFKLLDAEKRQEIKEKIKRVYEFYRFNFIKLFKPTWYQEKFMKAGAEYRIRFHQAGNRTGKTRGSCTEFAYHLTGLYPDWWEGLRVNDGGHTYWAIGINYDSLKKVLQKELLGTNNAKQRHLIGEGTIPRDLIDLKDGLETDGARVIQCTIKHKSGRDNTLMFYGCENESAMMGQKVRGILWDEEPPFNSINIYTQCLTRLQNSGGPGVDGFMIITATPENGQTALLDLFDKNESGKLYRQYNTMEDNPYLTEEQRQEYLAALPEWERDMRSKGIPIAGQGLVFARVDESKLVVAENIVKDFDDTMIGIDWGKSKDPTVLVVCTCNPETEHYSIIFEKVFDIDEYDRSPARVAEWILNSPFRGVPIIGGANDSGMGETSAEINLKILQRLGCNVYPDTFKNPPESMLKVTSLSASGAKSNAIDTGLAEMRLMMQQGRLSVHESCELWLKERRTYSYVFNRTTGKHGYNKGYEHSIDASRYALMSLMRGIGCKWYQRESDTSTQLQSFNTLQTSF
ncbi:terminase family protein [Salmonella enterica]|nr:terminase family protein [Salmonella enterica]